MKASAGRQSGRMSQGEKSCSGIANLGYVPSEGGRRETDLSSSGVQILNLIPPKPSPQIGPFEPLSEYFVPIKHHKNLFRRSETIYITKKENEKSRGWGCCLGGCSALLVAGIVTFALLAFLGQIPGIPGAEKPESLLGLNNQSQIPTSSESYSSTTELSSTLPTISNYLRNALDLEFSLENGTLVESLSDSSSSESRDLAMEVEGQMSSYIRASLGLEVSALVRDFSAGGRGIYVRMKIAWSEEAATYMLVQVQNALRNLSMLGKFQIRFLKTFGVINLCNFSHNGCSHTCSFSQTRHEFLCSCPENLVLGEDGRSCQVSTPPTTSTTAVTQAVTDGTTPPASTQSSQGTSGRSDLSTTTTTTTPILLESSTTASTTTTTSTEGTEPEMTTMLASSVEEEVTAPQQEEEVMTTEVEIQEIDTEGDQQYDVTTIATVIIE